jgi:hypothetical protein
LLYKLIDEKEEAHGGREKEAMAKMSSQYKSLCDTTEVLLS